MATHHENASVEPARNEQIITEFFAKSLHIILEARCPNVASRNYSGEQVMSSPSSSSSSSSSIRPRDKWFNLALRDCPAALENVDFWRQGNLDPMIADVILVEKASIGDPLGGSLKRGLNMSLSSKEGYYWNSGLDDFGNVATKEKVLERWVVQYERRKNDNAGASGGGGGLGSKRSSGSISLHNIYKKSTLLLRSLFATVRLLPAYKLFKELCSSPQIQTYNLVHKVSSFVEPVTHREEAEMQRFVFTPIDTYCGRLCLSVLYRSSVSDVNSEPSTPMSPQFIQDYVGSPMVDPLKMFPRGSPTSSPFERRHSWSYDLCYRASPTYSESRVTFHDKQPSHGLLLLPPSSLPRHLSEEPLQMHVKRSYDEYSPTPNLSYSPLPSPPPYARGINTSVALLRTESAPLTISASQVPGCPVLSNNQMLPSSPHPRNYRSVAAKTEAGKLLRAKISSTSPHKSFSRSSSKLSFQDDYDDSEFSGPFVVDDDNLVAPGSRSCSLDQPGQKETAIHSGLKRPQDAAVVVFRMMKHAPPLRHDLSVSSNSVIHGSRPDSSDTTNKNAATTQQGRMVSSSLISPNKTTADALEALHGFREMKNNILKTSGKATE